MYADIATSPDRLSMQQASGRDMGKSGEIQAKIGKKQEEVVERAAQYLRDLYPAKTAEHVAADTGLSANTVAKWLAGVSYPNGRATIALISTYGAEFLAAVMPERVEWISRAALDAEHNRLADKRRHIEARMRELRP